MIGYNELQELLDDLEELKSIRFENIYDAKKYLIGYFEAKIYDEDLNDGWFKFRYKNIDGSFNKKEDGLFGLGSELTYFYNEGACKLDISMQEED